MRFFRYTEVIEIRIQKNNNGEILDFEILFKAGVAGQIADEYTGQYYGCEYCGRPVKRTTSPNGVTGFSKARIAFMNMYFRSNKQSYKKILINLNLGGLKMEQTEWYGQYETLAKAIEDFVGADPSYENGFATYYALCTDLDDLEYNIWSEYSAEMSAAVAKCYGALDIWASKHIKD